MENRGGGGGGGDPPALEEVRIHDARPAEMMAPAQGFSSGLHYTQPPSRTALSGKLWALLFLVHLLAGASVVVFLAAHARSRKSRAKHWYNPLLTSVAFSVVAAAAWLAATLYRPLRALKASLWLAPLLTCASGVFLMDTESGAGVAFASVAIVVAVVMSLYACWVTPRLNYAGEILEASLSNVGVTSVWIKLVTTALAAAILFSLLWVVGVGGLAARQPRLAPVYVLALLLNLSWTTQVIRYTLYIAISRAAYLNLTVGLDQTDPVWSTLAQSFGTICLGSALIPATVVLRGTARAMGIVAGGSDEFLFSCASCYAGIADRAVANANRWAFVHVGRGLGDASRHAWSAFRKAGMVKLVDSDLTSSMCFLCGVSGGAACALAGCLWAIIVDKEYATGIALYAFLIGYFVVRIAMAWPQGCVSACLVAYAEDPQNSSFGPTISKRIRELQSS